MARSKRDERRVLSQDEQVLVDRSHHPYMRTLSDADLAQLTRLLRERRDRARDIARRQKREMRGKAVAVGGRAASDDTGSRAKADHLAAAVKRVNAESSRRQRKARRAETSAAPAIPTGTVAEQVAGR